MEGNGLNNTDRAELTKAICRVADGSTYYCNEVMKIILEKYKEEQKPTAQKVHRTEREREILRPIAQEKSGEEIAESFFISRRTVD